MAKLRALLPLAGVLLAGFLHAAPATASTTQAAMFQDDIQVKTNPTAALALMHNLGATRVRVGMQWDSVETRKGHYDFSLYNAIDRAAAADKISIYFMLTGPAPRWQTGSHADKGVAAGTWEPSTRGFGAFVKAAGAQFNGRHGVPRVNFWSIWNEPNYGQSLSPQTTNHNTVQTGAGLYRGLLDAAWSALVATGHRHDTILIGETAPRGVSDPGDFLGIKPLSFLRALYCVDGRYQPLRGSGARAIGCPTTNSGSHRFRADNPALFSASGFAAHLYALQASPGPPNRPTTLTGNSSHSDPNFADLPQVPALVGTLDRANGVYGSHARFPIWNTEYGYRTRPPDKVGVSQSLAAEYLNWAEYISYRQRRLANSMQYLLVDPASGIFASGLESPTGKPKATLAAYRMPLYLPSTSTRKGHSLEVWGGVRPAQITAQATHRAQKVAIQWRKGSKGPWVTVTTLTIRNRAGYIDTHVRFAGSGAVRLDWSPSPGGNYYSRTVAVTVR
ncbi:MAG: hypothetical protein QOG59_1233 [Solirubrobacteraceae bacterium]|nr:hypothetical protein [Solirubrobacteraceae bacterium]